MVNNGDLGPRMLVAPIDQITQVIDEIHQHPDSRRLIVNRMECG